MLAHFRTDRHNFIFVNVGSGLGDVSYRAIQDGIPAPQTLSVDKDETFWHLGRMALEGAGLPRWHAPFVEGDLLDEAFLPRLPHANAPSAGRVPDLDLWALTTLAPLQNRVSAIFAEQLFHLLPFAQQADLAARLAPLLAQKPGAMVFGRQRGGTAVQATHYEGGRMFLHSPESWRAMWAAAFPKGTINVETEVIPRPSNPESSNLWWSVVRVVHGIEAQADDLYSLTSKSLDSNQS
ncbi:hypothetical protein DFH09DRAFT_919464 [Mycena vulgaris]|nr:hypothetical protein DFH09DRAFT_919464 [Mycena vulgaris]